METKFATPLLRGLLTLIVPFFCCQTVLAQQEKGNKEVRLFSSGFSIIADSSEFISTSAVSGSEFRSRSTGGSFNVGGTLSYFLTQRHEISGGLHMSVFHFKSCGTVHSEGRFVDGDCSASTNLGLGFRGGYRFNFAEEGKKGFPFIGTEILVGDVTTNFTGNVSARPHAGYKYFLKRNIALDFSVGYFANLNKVKARDSFFSSEVTRGGVVNGQVGLSFVF